MNELKQKLSYWWIFLILGLGFLFGGFYVFNNTEKTFTALGFIFTISILLDGISGLFFSISNRQNKRSWNGQIALYALITIIGLMLLFDDELKSAALQLYIGFWVLVRSSIFMLIARKWRLLGYSRWKNNMIMGVVLGLLGLLMVLSQGFTASIVMGIAGFILMLLGVVLLLIGNQMRQIHEDIID